EQALRTSAGYIGMIGSKKKRNAIYKTLLSGGFTDEDLKRVQSPIGLPIDTDTPEEIAVSIVGQLIHSRSKKK
ncbi:MAG: XdhC family protein, partial [Deltaproteobacteria bacterium]|nr:XdhC family protein [Deltaproteobacteria bacterium]